MKRWHWAAIAVIFALADAVVWFNYRAPSVNDEQRAAKVGIRYLTHDSDANDYWPIFSPDGKTVLFSRQQSGEHTWHFFVVPADGGASRPFMRGAADVSATRANWSGKTDLIAFTNVLSGRASETWLVRGDGTQPRALTIQGVSGETDYPSWYPDGNELALMDPHNGVLQRVDVRKGTAVPITSHDRVMVG